VKGADRCRPAPSEHIPPKEFRIGSGVAVNSPPEISRTNALSTWSMEMTDKLIIHKCELLTFRDKKVFLNFRISKVKFANWPKILKIPQSFGLPRLKNQGRRIPSSDALGPFGGAIVLSLTETTMPQIGRIAIPQSRRRSRLTGRIRPFNRTRDPERSGGKNQGRRIPSSDALGPFGGAIVLSLTETTMPENGRIAIT
jgi:hypothetical protein